MRAAWTAAALALAAGGCLRTTAYTCETDGECKLAGDGVCEDVGYCSFADGTCPSGRRFGEGAGPYAGACVAADAIDAAVPDARVDAATDAADAASDAATDAPPVVGCTAPPGGTTFPNGPPCNGWGTPFSDNAQVQNNGGRLTITPVPNEPGARAGCDRAAAAFTADGVIVHLIDALAGSSSRTRVELPGTGLTMGVEGGQLVARAGGAVRGTTAFAPATMGWWRVRPQGGAVLFELSADGTHWSPLATANEAPPATAAIRVIGETPGAEASPGVARFGSVNLCP